MPKIRMKPFDLAWFFAEKPDAPAHFAPLIILSPPKGAPATYVGDLVEQWREHQEFRAPFNYLLGKGRLSWRVLADDEIDLDYHLRHWALPAPGGERELGRIVSRLHSTALDRRRPLWECHVIEGLESGRFALYLKLHHGQLDGVGAARLMSRILTTEPDATGLLPPWAVGMHRSGSARRAGRADRVKSAAIGFLRSAAAIPKAMLAVIRLRRDAAKQGRYPGLTGPYQAPRTILNHRISSQRRFATQHYKLQRFRSIAQAAGVSINDVFLSISGAALRRYLDEFGELPATSLTGQLPVNVRPTGDAKVGNALAFMFARLHTDIADPIKRLKAVHLSTTAGKARHEALPPETVTAFTMLMLGRYMTQLILGLGGRVRPAMNLVISNVPGPPQRLYFNGARVEQIYGPSVLFHGQALNVTMSSYAGDADISFTGCQEALPHLQRLAVYTGEALEELEKALSVVNHEPEAS